MQVNTVDQCHSTRMYFEIMLFFSGAVCTCAQTGRVLQYRYGCFAYGDTDVSVAVDGDELYHVDFKKKEAEWVRRLPSAVHNPRVYEIAWRNEAECPYPREWWENDQTIEEAKDAPEAFIYSKDKEVMGVENTLICFVNHFFPPNIKVRWTKNDVEVAVEDPVLSYLANPDGTFRHIATLDFTPQEGDIYACTVEHDALEGSTETRFWEPDIPESRSSGPAVFCGVGLVLGLLGIATGTFLYVKGNYLE